MDLCFTKSFLKHIIIVYLEFFRKQRPEETEKRSHLNVEGNLKFA